MGLFDFKQKNELIKLEKAAREAPSPSTYSALIIKYGQLEDEESALREAQLAIEKFPDSEELFELYSKLRRGQVKNEIEALKKAIEERPSTAAFSQLAEIYKDLRDEDSALRYCRAAIEKFPNDDSPYLIIGELRLRRFYRDFLVKDAMISIENLEKTVELNTRNYKALLLIAKLYLQIGGITKARQKLKTILLFAPEDGEVKKLLEISSKVSKPQHEDLDIMLQTIEENRELYYPLDDNKSRVIRKESLSPELFQPLLDNLISNQSISCLLVCDQEGNRIAQCAKEDVDVNTYYEVAATTYQTVQDASRQMDIGRIQRCQIEGPFGAVFIVGTQGPIYIAFGPQDVKAEQIKKVLDRLIADVSLKLNQGKL
jgi:tetratricopeptide (TPR) repeat protein